jgi:hypothetical protein
MLNLYSLKREEPIGYDEVDGFVIAAVDAESARVLAASQAADEGKRAWMAYDLNVTLIGISTADIDTERVILRSFNAG